MSQLSCGLGRVEKASLHQKFIAAATLLEKCRLLRNQSTSNFSLLYRLVE